MELSILGKSDWVWSGEAKEKSKDSQVIKLFIDVNYNTGFDGQFVENLDMVKLTLFKGRHSKQIQIWCCRKE